MSDGTHFSERYKIFVKKRKGRSASCVGPFFSTPSSCLAECFWLGQIPRKSTPALFNPSLLLPSLSFSSATSSSFTSSSPCLQLSQPVLLSLHHSLTLEERRMVRNTLPVSNPHVVELIQWRGNRREIVHLAVQTRCTTPEQLHSGQSRSTNP